MFNGDHMLKKAVYAQSPVYKQSLTAHSQIATASPRGGASVAPLLRNDDFAAALSLDGSAVAKSEYSLPQVWLQRMSPQNWADLARHQAPGMGEPAGGYPGQGTW